MADIKADRVSFTDKHVLWKWVEVDSGDTCLPVEVWGHKEMTIATIGGTWGSASIGVTGSVSGDGYAALTNAARELIAHTADGLSEILQVCGSVAPTITGADGVGIDIYLYTRL